MMLFSALGISQVSVAELGENANLSYVVDQNRFLNRGPCGYDQPTNGFPNAGNISDPSSFSAADDFVFPVAHTFEPTTVILPLLTTAGSSITGVEVTFYADTGGLPGAIVGSSAMAAPASQNVIGSAFGRDIVETSVDLSGAGVSLPGGAAGTSYFMGIRATNSSGNTDLFWELTNTIQNGESAFSYVKENEEKCDQSCGRWRGGSHDLCRLRSCDLEQI